MLLRQALLQAERGDYPQPIGAMVRVAMAKSIVDQDRSDEGEALLKDILSNDLNFDNETFRAIVIQWFAQMIQNQGRHAEAEGLLRQALAIKEKNGENVLSRAAAVGQLGHLMLEQRKFEDAEALFRQELRLREEGGDSVYSRGFAMGSLAYALAGQGRLNDACQILAQAQALLDELRRASPIG